MISIARLRQRIAPASTSSIVRAKRSCLRKRRLNASPYRGVVLPTCLQNEDRRAASSAGNVHLVSTDIDHPARCGVTRPKGVNGDRVIRSGSYHYQSGENND